MQRIFEKTGFMCLTLMLSLVWASSLYGAVTYTYDDRNRLVSADYNDGQMVITYAYNSNGSRVSKSIPPDTDEDGLLDALETDPGVCTLYNDADTDDDGILDGTEDADRNGIFDAGETDPCDDDTDGDGLYDGTEAGYTLAHITAYTDPAVFVPDADPATTTSPLNPDSDGDGMTDGEEDANFNGQVDDGETDPLINDDAPALTATDPAASSTVDAADQISITLFDEDGIDAGAVPNSLEVKDSAGQPVAGATTDAGGTATEQTFVFSPDIQPFPFDTYTVSFNAADLSGNAREYVFTFTVQPVDTDNDGIPDADEVIVFATNPYNADTDGDGILDGTEAGYTLADICAGTDTALFVPDADPSTTTDPTAADTDGDNLGDGEEDANFNGQVDAGETDPCEADTDGDGLRDGEEAGYGTDPLTMDSDEDGIDDGDELAYWGTDLDVDFDDDGIANNLLDADADNDGYDDGLEIGWGSDPADNNSLPLVILYVDGNASGNNDGSSWEDAYVYLQDALAAAASGDQIWVAAGTYYPDEGSGQSENDRISSFHMPDSIPVFGGFAGDETRASQRDWENNITVLSGDLNQDDSGGGDNSENAYNVVSYGGASELTVLDGFTITSGNADSSSSDPDGYNQSGGGVKIRATYDDCNAKLYNCRICGNIATHSGAGIYMYTSTATVSLALTNCIISENGPSYYGGGIYLDNQQGTMCPSFTNCDISDNEGTFEGGGVFNGSGSSNGPLSPVFVDCVLSGNSGARGGGMYNQSNGYGKEDEPTVNPSLINCVISDNSASHGGALYNYTYEGGILNLSMTNCAVTGNNSPSTGSGMYNRCNIYLESDGGTINSALVNCTFNGNNSTPTGSLIENENNDGWINPVLTNCVLWGNTGATINNNAGTIPATPEYAYCDIEGSGGSIAWDSTLGTDMGNNIDADPLFADTVGGDLHLMAGSPCVDVGDNSVNSEPYDLSGAPRIQNETINLGAYESVFEDSDNDGLSDTLENDPGSCTDAYDSDTDDDGLLDGEEDANHNGIVDAGETDPCDADTDEDGLPDGWEAAYGLDPLDNADAEKDADFDRMTNLAEYAAGTDPTAYHIFTGTIYVDASAAGSDNGTSWEDAFVCLQDALRAAGTIAGSFPEVWVAGDTYYPNEGSNLVDGVSDLRALTFDIASDVKVYGGFAGTEDILDERNLEENETILSGDINQDDNGGFIFYRNNAFSVVSFIGVTDQTILDGFTITGGFAVSDAVEIGHDVSGGGIYNYTEGEGNTGSPQIANCTISGNLGLVGGGMVNIAVDGGTGSPAMTNCIFSSNTADSDGGGMCNTGMNGGIANPVLVDCTFSNNSSANGGGMANKAWDGTGSPALTNCIFDNNLAFYGGGMLNASLENGSICSPNMISCVFHNNMADYYGGGMANEGIDGGISSPELINCSFTDNASVNGGGMMNMADDGTTSPTLTNCVFSQNMADNGGGVDNTGFHGGNSSPELINCTISNNRATFEGGGINNNKAGSGAAVTPYLVNTILWNNQAPAGPEVFNAGGAEPLFAYCDIKGSGGSAAWDTSMGTDSGNNIDADPLFVDAAGCDLHLRAGSPCIQAGDNTANPEPTDMDGELRIQDDTIDLGAYEGWKHIYANLIEWNGNLVADFGDRGLRYHDGTSWSILVSWGYVNQMTVWNGHLVVDFGGGRGLRFYDGSSWHLLTSWDDVNQMIVWNGNLVVDFGGGRGLRYHDGASWQFLVGWDDVNKMLVWNDNLVVDFGGGRGLRYHDGTSWILLLSWDDLNDMIIWNDNLVVDFGGDYGIRYYDGTSWRFLTSLSDANQMITWNGNLVVDFGDGRGLRYHDGASWQFLTSWDDTADMVSWNDNGIEILVVDFGDDRNMRSYDGTSWQFLVSWHDVPEMITWNTGSRELLVVDFGSTHGLRAFDGSWILLTSWTTAE